MNYKILVTAPSLHPAGLNALDARHCDVDFLDFAVGESGLRECLGQKPYDGIVSRTLRIDAASLDVCPSLRAISKHGVGISNIDLTAASDRSIAVFHTPGANAQAVAEYTMALMLAASRKIVQFDTSVRSGEWKRLGDGIQLSGKTIGLVGFGRVARKVAAIAQSFSMRVIAFDPILSEDEIDAVEICGDLAELLSQCNILSLHCPAALGAPPLIGDKELATLPAGAVIVNSARGELIDERALVASIESGHVAAAGLDTFAREPLPHDDPLLAQPNIVVSPHIAGSTPEALAAMATGAVRYLLSYLDLQSGRVPEADIEALSRVCANGPEFIELALRRKPLSPAERIRPVNGQ